MIPPSYIVVDNREEHLKAILEAFQQLETPCLGIRYDPADGIGERKLRNVRVLFLDLHLIDAPATTDERQHYTVIAGILRDNVSPDGGPFVLVVWTEYEDKAEGLGNYLNEDAHLGSGVPLEIIILPKSEFIDTNSGEPLPGNTLLERVQEAISKNPRLNALLSWEADVQAAAGETLAELMKLVPKDERNTEQYDAGLDKVLSGLASAAVGRDHVDDDPRGAISSVLAPLLADRILNQENESSELWKEAITQHRNGGEIPSTPENSGRVNRMLHAAVRSSEKIGPTDWGAVVEFPAEWRDDEQLRARFGLTERELLGGEFRLDRNDRDPGRLRLIRIGAACDYAQNRLGPLPYLLGVEIPCDANLKTGRDGKPLRAPASEWTSPALLVDHEKPFRLTVNVRYSYSATAEIAGTWKALYRLREQLLMHLISHASGYLSRPGIVEMG